MAKGMEVKDVMSPKPFYNAHLPDEWYCVQNWWDEKVSASEASAWGIGGGERQKRTKCFSNPSILTSQLSSCAAPQECLPDEVFSGGKASINNKDYTSSPPENSNFPGMVLPFFCNADS